MMSFVRWALVGGLICVLACSDASGVTVEFRALPVSGVQCPLGGCSVILADSTVYAGTLIDKPTDARGRAAVRVQLGIVVPLGRILITAQGGAVADTASFTIEPAAPARVVAIPKDTALFVAGNFALRGTVTDQRSEEHTS